MACCLFSAKPLPEPMLAYFQLDPWESSPFKKMHLKLSSAKMAAILSRGRWVHLVHWGPGVDTPHPMWTQGGWKVCYLWSASGSSYVSIRDNEWLSNLVWLCVYITHWKPRVVMMPTSSSLVPLEVVLWQPPLLPEMAKLASWILVAFQCLDQKGHEIVIQMCMCGTHAWNNLTLIDQWKYEDTKLWAETYELSVILWQEGVMV